MPTLRAVPIPRTPLGGAALHSKLSLRLGMVTHAKQTVYIIHFKCIASLSHLDFGTSPSIQLCPDLTTVHVGQKPRATSSGLKHYFQRCCCSVHHVSWVLYNHTVYYLYHVFIGASLLKRKFIAVNTIVLL